MKIDPKTYTAIPTGDYKARITSLDTVEGLYGTQLRWTCYLGDVLNVEGEIETALSIPWYMNPVLTGGARPSKLHGLVTAAGLNPDEPLDTDDLLGKIVVLTVVAETKDGVLRNKITGCYAPKKTTGAAVKTAPVKPSATVDDDDNAPF